MLLGLIVFINVPAISAYAATVALGTADGWNSKIGTHLSTGDSLTWKFDTSNNTNPVAVRYLSSDNSLIGIHETHTNAPLNLTGQTTTYEVLTMTALKGVDGTARIDKGEPAYWELLSFNRNDDGLFMIELKAHYNEPKNDGGDWTHEHHYEWVVTREATEDEGGEEAYMCECGAVLYRAPISAAGVFIKNTINKIINAKPGETVEITTEKWLTFNKDVADALSTRPDITLKINYREEGHKGPRLSTTLPKGTDLHKYLNDEGYVGFLYLRTLFPTTPYIPKQ